MEIIIRGIRENVPNFSPETAFYGGNTAIVEARLSECRVFFDAGTGLLNACSGLPESGECHIFLTGNPHHLLGLASNSILYSPLWKVHLYLPRQLESWLDQYIFTTPLLSGQNNPSRRLLDPNDVVSLPGHEKANVRACQVNHSRQGLAYRLVSNEGAFFYAGFNETSDFSAAGQGLELLTDVDLAVVANGHWLDLAEKAGVPRLVLTNHPATMTDVELDAWQQVLSQQRNNNSGQIRYVAREGLNLTLPVNYAHQVFNKPQLSNWMNIFLSKLANSADEKVIINQILSKTRELTGAEAGTIFLVNDDGSLYFAYTQNEALFEANPKIKYTFDAANLPISHQSIVGYAAFTGLTVNIKDVYDMAGEHYTFNREFDDITGYRTQSMLTIPFFAHTGSLIGVLQLINSLDPVTGRPAPFPHDLELPLKKLVNEAANIIERNTVVRNSIYQNINRMINFAALRDPTETGPHAERVGAMAARLFQGHAVKMGRLVSDIRNEQKDIYMAAMLHDLGKLGITDSILQKPGKLTEVEFTIMRSHTALGASLLARENEPIISLAKEIALHHHQKWNGLGYCGANDNGRLAEEDIPLSARITAVADVFDALVSPRCYKETWSFDRAMEYMFTESGKHFDPDIVSFLAESKDEIRSIFLRFPEWPTQKLEGKICHPEK
ncbi:MAG: HD domain-containing protein [Candidatus Adiutrix sp.]|nr:HD domain-containing protein [Candidatus Adiutrix sp.]